MVDNWLDHRPTEMFCPRRKVANLLNFLFSISLDGTSYQMVYCSFSEYFISIVLWSAPQRIPNCFQLTCLILSACPNAKKHILDTCWEPARCPHSLITILQCFWGKCLLLHRKKCILYWYNNVIYHIKNLQVLSAVADIV